MVSFKERIATINSTLAAAKRTGVTNLSQKGIPARETESVSSLFGKIGQIQTGSNGKIAHINIGLNVAATSRFTTGSSSQAWMTISSARSWSISTPTLGISISSGLLFYQNRPVMITGLYCDETSRAYTSATATNFTCRTVGYTALLALADASVSGSEPSCLVSMGVKNSSGGTIANTNGNTFRQWRYTCNLANSFGIAYGTAMTSAERNAVTNTTRTGGTYYIQSASHWTNRLPTQWYSYSTTTTTKYHALSSYEFHVTGFVLL